MNTDKKISVILPTYNEKDNVKTVIDEIIHNVLRLGEIIVVDDNSPDGTWAVVEDIAKRDNRIKLIKRVNERGLTSAIWTGIINAKGGYIVWMDCDMGMPPGLIPVLINELDSCDIAVGSRYISGGGDLRPLFRRITSRFLNNFSGFVLGIGIKDLTSGFIASKREIFNKIKLQGNYGEYCIRFLFEANKAGYKIKEVPYIFKDRTTGKSKSKANFFRFGIGYFNTILRLRGEFHD